MADRIFHFTPKDAIEAAAVLGACTRIKAAGLRLRAGVLESQHEPARGLELPQPSASIGDLEAISPSDSATIIVSHAAMDRIEEISKDDYLAVVGGGVRFGDLAAAVREAGLVFPHEPDERTEGMALAGLIMAGARFPMDGRYGRLREYVLALELAIPKGEVIRTGSRAVKDVTGYDLAGFVMGSGGRCGMIARVTLRLLPMPFDRADMAAGEPGGPRSGGAERPARGAEACEHDGVSFEPGKSESCGRGSESAARALDDLAGRLYRIFDPELIMLP